MCWWSIALPSAYTTVVSKKLQKHLGHKKQIIGGKAFAVMPPKAGTPWKLRQKFATSIEQTERVAEADSDSDGSELDAIFDAQQDKHVEALERATKNASSLEDMIAAVEAEGGSFGAPSQQGSGILDEACSPVGG